MNINETNIQVIKFSQPKDFKVINWGLKLQSNYSFACLEEPFVLSSVNFDPQTSKLPQDQSETKKITKFLRDPYVTIVRIVNYSQKTLNRVYHAFYTVNRSLLTVAINSTANRKKNVFNGKHMQPKL